MRGVPLPRQARSSKRKKDTNLITGGVKTRRRTLSERERFTCPACGYPGLRDPPWDKGPSDEICPSCGLQFGYDDAAGGDARSRERIYARWREEWKQAGCPWWSRNTAAPRNWDAQRQLSAVEAK